MLYGTSLCITWPIIWLPLTREYFFGFNSSGHCLVLVQMLYRAFFMWRHIKPILHVIPLATAMLVSFCIARYIRKYNKMSPYFLSSSYHNTKLRASNKNIKTLTRLKFQILLWTKSEVTADFVVFLHTLQYKKETRSETKSCAYRCVPRRANSLLFTCRLAYNYNAIAHAFNAANVHTQDSNRAR